MSFGDFGLQAIDRARLTARQIEAARIAMTRYVKRGGKIWIRIFPDKPITKKPAETRMGKGKGNPEDWVAVVKPGRILYEMEGVRPEIARGGVPPRGAQAARTDALRAAGGVLMKASELRQLSGGRAPLEVRGAARRALRSARMKHETGQLENMAKLSTLRRDVARVETVLRGKLGGDAVSERGQRRTLTAWWSATRWTRPSWCGWSASSRTRATRSTCAATRGSWPTTRTNACAVGDQVRIIEHRPLSKRKRWKVQETLVKATGV